MSTFQAKRVALAPLAAALLAAGGAIALAPAAAAQPDACIPGFVWREAFAGDHVCVTPGVRSRTAAENGAAAGNAVPGSPTCKSGFVWREASPGDKVCVIPSVRDEAATDNAAAASRVAKAAPAQPKPEEKPAPKAEAPKQGPTVNWSPRVGGLTAHIADRSGVASQCTYDSDGYSRSFPLPANGSFDLAIVPAIPKFANWNVSIKCDNGTVTNTQTFF